ncbi:GntR family transcriptional regulator [Herbaspirillum chlorophenolicum]|uniref:GntR family transcriptional regulator n=1 Tax=Herbaspirillum chlorophenolicum TaxID=211589 RepID=A0ABW8F4K9_9BURK|nr:GntR family transcriptional regulator [Herbaspirillum chlorophenolicum]
MQPRYAELAQQLIDEISTGKLGIGAALPSEIELSAQYGVSRSTVRSALQMVQDLGLISRRKRAGIRIEALKPQRPFEQSISNVEDLVQFAAVTERRIQGIDEIESDAALSAQLRCAAGHRWLRAAMLRVDPAKPDAPICWTDVYLDHSVASGIRRQLRKSTGLICEAVEEKYGRVVSELQQEIRAVGVPERFAEALGVEADSHALEITRHYLDQDGEVFEVTVSVFPADRFTYALNLKR